MTYQVARVIRLLRQAFEDAYKNMCIFCVCFGVMYAGKYNVFDVTLCVYTCV
jgi:hypothetical protein